MVIIGISLVLLVLVTIFIIIPGFNKPMGLPKYEGPEMPKKKFEEVTDPFTKDEWEVMRCITDAHEKFLELDNGGNYHGALIDWVNNIHGLQMILEHRVLKRMYPKMFK